MKTPKNPHSTHPSTRQGSVWPAARRVWSPHWVVAYAAFSLSFLFSHFFLVAHKIKKTPKKLETLKIPSPSSLRLGTPHRATAWDSCRRGLGPRFEAHTGCDLDGFPFVISIVFLGFGVWTAYSYICISYRTVSENLLPFQPSTRQVICKCSGLQFGTAVARGSMSKVEAHTGREWGI